MEKRRKYDFLGNSELSSQSYLAAGLGLALMVGSFFMEPIKSPVTREEIKVESVQRTSDVDRSGLFLGGTSFFLMGLGGVLYSSRRYS